MSAVMRLFLWLARHGRKVLILGLVTGIAFPDLAKALSHWLPEMVAALLFIASLRIGPKQAVGTLSDLRITLALSVIYQVVIPCGLILVLIGFGIGGPLALALVIMACASTIAGSPNLTLMTGNDPAAALRLLVVGTALLPLTVLPVLALEPSFGSFTAIASTSFRLLVVIGLAAFFAFVIRGVFMKNPSQQLLGAIDGLSALAMAIVVIGLMSAVGPALFHEPLRFSGVMALAFAANFGLQIAAFLAGRKFLPSADLPAYAICAGNRNMALFLVALPAEVTGPMLLFIGCYQVPMYLTPVLLGRLYAKGSIKWPAR